MAVSKENNSLELVLNAELNKAGVKEKTQEVKHSDERKCFDDACTHLTKLRKLLNIRHHMGWLKIYRGLIAFR